jgi:hypothetical protein
VGSYNPFTPFSLAENANIQAPSEWYQAADYNAVYGQQVEVPGKFRKADPYVQPSAASCQAACVALPKNGTKPGCTIWAWSGASRHCWFRLDGVWGAPETLHREGKRFSGCLQGADPDTGTPYVTGCGHNPIGPAPGPSPHSPRIFYYGTRQNDIGPSRGRGDNNGPSSTLPILSRIDIEAELEDSGLSLVQSPEDTPIVAYASTELIAPAATATTSLAATLPAAAGAGATTSGAWLNWTRLYHRMGGGSNDSMPISFSADFVAHAPDWRPAAAWTRSRYPRFFEPDSAAVASGTMERIAGTASYADLRGPPDFAPEAAAHYKSFGWGLNWDSSARFPWHGEWMPTATDGFGPDEWLTCFTHAAPDQHTHEPCTNVSYAQLQSWYAHIHSMGESVGSSFSSCQYGNLFEFGWQVKAVWPLAKSKANCTPAAIAVSNHTRLLCHTQQLLRDKYGDALLFAPSAPDRETGELVCGGLDGSCIMDPHPDLPYLAHILDMARTSMAKAPSSGVCIDRQDWLGSVNPNADDKRTWLPVKHAKGKTQFMRVRAMINSWKPAMRAFAQVWHSGGKAVIINDHSNRLDMMEHVDGIYAEMGDMDTISSSRSGLGSLNAHAIGTALATLGPKPAYIWNHAKTASKMTPQYVSAGLQAHLWAGVFPTVPVKNNDHAIGGDCAPDCPYDATFAAYGPLFSAIRGRQWGLVANAATVPSENALANLFYREDLQQRGGNSSGRVYLAPIIQAPIVSTPAGTTVNASFRGMQFSCSEQQLRTTFMFPGGNFTPADSAGEVLAIQSGHQCEGGWGDDEGAVCAQVNVRFGAAEAGGGVLELAGAVLVVMECG